MFSVSGIREGFFYDLLSDSQKREDALLASAEDLAALIGRHGSLRQGALPVDEPRSSPASRCRGSGCAWRCHALRARLGDRPNFRAGWAYHRIIQSSLKGMDHKERLMLALALYHRYQTKWKGEKTELKLLDERERLWSRCVGLAANLALPSFPAAARATCTTPSSPGTTVRSSWRSTRKPRPCAPETVEKRLDGLGDALRAFANFVI
ncbi:MAG: hypothetical protein WDN72_00635 [Alphaproteobacteria bacterium]